MSILILLLLLLVFFILLGDFELTINSYVFGFNGVFYVALYLFLNLRYQTEKKKMFYFYKKTDK